MITGRRVRKTIDLLAIVYGTRCAKCGAVIDLWRKHPDPLSPSIGHQLPRSRGGSDDLGNLRLEHLRCNEAAGNRIGGQARISECGAGFDWLFF